MIKLFLDMLLDARWTQTAISKKAEIPQSVISKVIHGGDCGLETVVKLADAFGVSTDEVLGRSPSKPRSPIIEKIEQIVGNDEEIAREALRCAEDKKLIKEVRGEKGRGRQKAA